MSGLDQPFKRGERPSARRFEALRQEAVAGRNVRPGTNTFGIQTGAGASSISKDTLPELAEVEAVMVVAEWADDKPVWFNIGAIIKMTDAVTTKISYYRCMRDHWSGGLTEPGTPGAAATWTLIHTPYTVYILDAQSGAQTHEFQPVFIDDDGLAVPQFTRGYLGTSRSGDKFLLPHTEEGQWYLFSHSNVAIAATNFWLAPLDTNYGFAAAAPPWAHGYDFLPECRAGYITDIRASWFRMDAAGGTIAAGQIEIWPVRATQADTRNGGTNTWNLLSGSFSLVLDATHHTNSSTGHAGVVIAGDGIGVFAQTDAAYAFAGAGYPVVECWIKMAHSG